MNILAPSILSIDFGHMERELLKVYKKKLKFVIMFCLLI